MAILDKKIFLCEKVRNLIGHLHMPNDAYIHIPTHFIHILTKMDDASTHAE